MTKDQIKALVVIASQTYNIIKDAGDVGVPSGHLYALLMERGMELDTYQNLIQFLKDEGLITETNYLLKVKS